MPGMGRGLEANNPLVISTFHALLTHQFLIVGAVLCVFLLGSAVVRLSALNRLSDPVSGATGRGAGEPPARMVVPHRLRDSLDPRRGAPIQSAMPLGMPGGVLQPAGGGRGQLLTMVGEMAGTS